MGAANSKAPSDAAIQEKLFERLQALQTKDNISINEKEGYVCVDNSSDKKAGASVVGAAKFKHSQEISASSIEEWEKELLEDAKNRLALAALTSNPTNAVLSSRSTIINDTQIFNISIPLEGAPVTNQQASGRCWLFASTNIFRIAVMKKYRLSEFQLSQAYLFYWDKIEKANFFLENVLDTLDEEVEGRLMQTLLASPVGDGGQWDMVANLVKKYGLVPQSLYPDAWSAMNSVTMDRLITTKLREDALRLRFLASSSSSSSSDKESKITAAKAHMLKEIHLILTLMLGPPPDPTTPFTWSFYDRDHKLSTVSTTPKSFAADLSDAKTVRALGGTNVATLFSLVNDPRNPYNRLLSVSRLGNVIEGRPVTYVNVDMDTMKKACIAMLQRGLPVFFGCDVGKYSDSARGIMDTALYEYELGFNIRLGLSKAERLQTGESAMTHAMVLTGVHVVEGKSVRWRVENSWGEGRGEKGYFVMSDAWMDEFVYQAVVEPGVVSREVRKVLEQRPEMLDLWDPMGALA